jgi:hypothetical protein
MAFLRFQTKPSEQSIKVWDALKIVEQTEPGVDDGMPHGFPMSDFSDQFLIRQLEYSRRRNKAPLVSVPLNQLLATQNDVERAGVAFHILHPNAVPAHTRTKFGHEFGHADKPIVVRYNSELHIVDGHHRLTALKLQDKEHALVRFVDLDAP